MNTTSKIYHFIGQNIVEAINEDWKNAEVLFEVLDGYLGIEGTYINAKGETKDLDVSLFDEDLDNEIFDLQEITEGDGQDRWNKAIFKIDNSFNFDMQFIWDQEYADEIERLSKE